MFLLELEPQWSKELNRQLRELEQKVSLTCVPELAEKINDKIYDIQKLIYANWV